MVSHDDVCESCGAVGRTRRTRWPDGERREMCGPCQRKWQLIWRHFCEYQPRQANRVRAKANRDNLARPDGGEPMTDGGHSADGTEQVALSRNPVEREVARFDRDGRKPICPDCGSYVGHSKSGGKPLPDTEAEAFGWSCGDCNLTLPSNCHGSTAPGFNSSMAGMQVEFRDGETRWVPVPARYVDTATDPEGSR